MVENLEFKWGKKRGRGKGEKNKGVMFYESFSYDGVEYSLYDNVYLYSEGGTEPDIGKLIKIWEAPNEKKNVKVLWYFRPCEISPYLTDEVTHENELFLASGIGNGLCNINPLEAIAGKCNVVCISKDSRNPQPSHNELRMADFVFYRTFDVGQCIVLDKIDDVIADVEVKSLLNKQGFLKPIATQMLGEESKQVNGNDVETGDVVILSKPHTSERQESAEIGSMTSVEENADSKALLTAEESVSYDRKANTYSDKLYSRPEVKENTDLKVSLIEQKLSSREKPLLAIGAGLEERTKTNYRQGNIVMLGAENIQATVNDVGTGDTVILSKPNTSEKQTSGETDSKAVGALVKENMETEASLAAEKPVSEDRQKNTSIDKFYLRPKVIKNTDLKISLVEQKFSSREKPILGIGAGLEGRTKTICRQENVLVRAKNKQATVNDVETGDTMILSKLNTSERQKSGVMDSKAVSTLLKENSDSEASLTTEKLVSSDKQENTSIDKSDLRSKIKENTDLKVLSGKKKSTSREKPILVIGAGLEVKTKTDRRQESISVLGAEIEQAAGNDVETGCTMVLSKPNTSKRQNSGETDGNVVCGLLKKNVDLEALLTAEKAVSNNRQENTSDDKSDLRSKVKENTDLKASLIEQKSFSREKPLLVIGAGLEGRKKPNYRQEDVSADRTSLGCKVKENAEPKASIVKQEPLLVKEDATIVDEEGVEFSGIDKSQDNISVLRTMSRTQVDSDGGEADARTVLVNRFEVCNKLKSANDLASLGDRPYKKAKLDHSLKLHDDKKKGNAKALPVSNVAISEDRLKLANDAQEKETSASKKLKVDDKHMKLTTGKLTKASSALSPKDENITGKREFEVTCSPESERSKWFIELPWDTRMQNAREVGKLVLLQNLDPTYTSADVEDIVRDAFRETCTAKMCQRTAFSSHHSGQAFVIFRTREAAETVVTRLEEQCLLLPNGRPLVARVANSFFERRDSRFFGHLILDGFKYKMHRQTKEAVSTSHCSQPNTYEYDMAMEWCLLQERIDLSWKKLYELHEKELRGVKANLKSK